VRIFFVYFCILEIWCIDGVLSVKELTRQHLIPSQYNLIYVNMSNMVKFPNGGVIEL